MVSMKSSSCCRWWMRHWRRLALSATPSAASIEGSFCSSMVATTAMVRLNCWYDCRGGPRGQHPKTSTKRPQFLVYKPKRHPINPLLPTAPRLKNAPQNAKFTPPPPPSIAPKAPQVRSPPSCSHPGAHPGAARTHQLDLCLLGQDSSRTEIDAGRERRWEHGAALVLARHSLGGAKGKEGSEGKRTEPNWSCQRRSLAQDWSPCGRSHWFVTLPSGARAAPAPPLPQFLSLVRQ